MKNMKKRVASILIATILCIVWLVIPSRAAQAAGEVKVTDAYNHSLAIKQAPRRVVSLVPGVTEMLLALGLRPRPGRKARGGGRIFPPPDSGHRPMSA
jgi:ABC-type Fe3+-hydroxamate transport system substrate-binding protein